MSKQREALELALEALEDYQANGAPFFKCDSAVSAIREALAEPEPWTPDDMACRPGGLSMNTEQGINPRPIGFWNGKETAYFEHELVDGCLPIGDCTIPLYAYPPTRKPLTDEEIMKTAKETQSAEPGRDGYILPFAFARAIERAHGITE